MCHFKLVTIAILHSVTIALCQTSLLDQLKYITSHGQYATQIHPQLQAPFSIKNIMAISNEAAMRACQNSFEWQRWNCPSSDFIRRRSSKFLLLDREDSYVNAITTAAVLYTITKNCSSGIINECDACSDNPYSSNCSDNPKVAEQLLGKHNSMDFSNGFHSKIAEHNYKVVTNLLQKSLVKQCGCAVAGANGLCSKELCLQVLKPFEDIAADIYQMYEEGIQLINTPGNSRIMWENIPLDALVFIKDSPNYCEPDAIPHWNGMRGRLCTSGKNGKSLTKEERNRCRHLCRECGYSVLPKDVVMESRCNCKFTWGFQIHCETCVTVQRHIVCY